MHVHGTHVHPALHRLCTALLASSGTFLDAVALDFVT